MPLSFRYRYLSDDWGRDWRSLRRPDPIKPATDAHIGAQAVSASAREPTLPPMLAKSGSEESVRRKGAGCSYR